MCVYFCLFRDEIRLYVFIPFYMYKAYNLCGAFNLILRTKKLIIFTSKFLFLINFISMYKKRS